MKAFHFDRRSGFFSQTILLKCRYLIEKLRARELIITYLVVDALNELNIGNVHAPTECTVRQEPHGINSHYIQ